MSVPGAAPEMQGVFAAFEALADAHTRGKPCWGRPPLPNCRVKGGGGMNTSTVDAGDWDPVARGWFLLMQQCVPVVRADSGAVRTGAHRRSVLCGSWTVA